MTSFNMIKPRLPAEYQEVEYIQSNGGGQWMNTLYKPTNKTKIICDFLFGGSPAYMLGIIADNNTNSFVVTFAGGIIYLRCGGATNALFNDKVVNTRYKAEMSIDSLKLDGIVQSVANVGTATPTNHSILLFGRINDDTVQTSPTACRIYACKIAEENEPMRNYVPCFRRSDGVIGLYDLAGSVCPLTGIPFYVNAGTGSFSKGPDVQPLIPFGIAGKIGEISQIAPAFEQNNGYREYNYSTTFSYSNNIVTLSGAGSVDITNFEYLRLVQSHKYLVMVKAKPIANSSFYIRQAVFGTLLSIALIGNQWNNVNNIITAGNNNSLLLQGSNGLQLSELDVFDLTDIFESGNEPTTYVQARRLIKLKLGIDIAYYQPYGLNQAVPGLKRLIGA